MDALASLLLVIIFVIIGSLVSQMHMSTILSDTDTSLKALQERYGSAKTKLLQSEQEQRRLLHDLRNLQEVLALLRSSEARLKAHSVTLDASNTELRAQYQKIQEVLNSEKAQAASHEQDLKNEFAALITKKTEELKKVAEELKVLQLQIPESIRKNPELLKYRSEFFGALQDVLGGRSDIRPVGDRFVFQAEVLFEQGSDKLGAKGQEVLNTLAKILKEVSQKIPQHITWVLRVDGHTDKVPIHNDRFDSNWELSLARAACVIKYLIQKGINPKNLAAAGFAEHCPLETDVTKIAKNRRIEFRFDQL